MMAQKQLKAISSITHMLTEVAKYQLQSHEDEPFVAHPQGIDRIDLAALAVRLGLH